MLKNGENIILITLFTVLVYLVANIIGLTEYIFIAWHSEDFRLGVLAEMHGIIIEAILIIGVYSYIAKRKENKEWRPTRLLVARHICRLHQNVFNSLKYTMDINYHTDLSLHGFPKGFTQSEADAWGREHQINWLDTPYNELTEMITYNNVALNSSFQPLVITYVVHVKTIISMLKFTLSAYKQPTMKNGGSFNYVGLLEMEKIYKKILEDFSEINLLEKPSTGKVITAKEILAFVEESNKECAFLDLRIIK